MSNDGGSQWHVGWGLVKHIGGYLLLGVEGSGSKVPSVSAQDPCTLVASAPQTVLDAGSACESLSQQTWKKGR